MKKVSVGIALVARWGALLALGWSGLPSGLAADTSSPTTTPVL